MKQLLKQNFIPLAFFLCALHTELTAVAVTSGRWTVNSPWVFLSLTALATAALYLLPKNSLRHLCAAIALAVLFAVDLVFIVIYEMTGTIFDFSMLKLRNDAMAILESVPINFTYVAVSGVLLSAFMVFGRAFDDGSPVKLPKTPFRAAVAVTLALCLCHGGAVVAAVRQDRGDTSAELYGDSADGYAQMGVTGNFLTELYAGLFTEVEVGDPKEIGQFIYREVSDGTSPTFGMAQDYNVVTILAESLEWFAFMADEGLYPYGHTASEEVLRQLYPNFYAFYDSSYVLTNYHSREKTDISENLSLLGNYPMDYYINYDYAQNALPWSLPHVLQELYGVESYSFHNGTETFYNRNQYLTEAVGFRDFISAEDMDIEDVYFGNLDSQMLEACKDQMFPTDRRFNTYITTITMHGQYAHRDNLQPYYDRLDAYGLLPLSEDENANAFRYYAAAAMDTDRMLGLLLEDLREKELLDKTLILLFSDHNAYYQYISSYVKDKYPQSDPTDMTDLYRVPCMIKVGDMQEQVIIDKFTCTADLLPTTMHLLGIRYFENLYYGVPAFEEQESVIYSRAYDVFLTDKIYFPTIRNILWQDPSTGAAYRQQVEKTAARLMEKHSYVNRIFAGDFFAGEETDVFYKNMKELNGIA